MQDRKKMNKNILSPILVHELLRITLLPIELARLIQDYLPIHIATLNDKNELSTINIQDQHPAWTDWFNCTHSIRMNDRHIFARTTGNFVTVVNMDEITATKSKSMLRPIIMLAMYNNQVYIKYSMADIFYNPLTGMESLVNVNDISPSTASCIIHQNYLYVLGGYRNYNASSYCQRFDLQTYVWKEISTLNERRADAKVIIVDNQIIVMGGWNYFNYETDHDQYTNTVEYYDIQKNKWTIANWRLPLEITVFCAYLIPYTNQLVISQNKKNWIRSLHCDFVSDDWKELSF